MLRQEWGPGICHFSSTCRFTFEGLKNCPNGEVGEERSYFFSSFPHVQLPNKDSSFLLSEELCDLILLLVLFQISQPIFMHSVFLMKSTWLKSIKPLFSFLLLFSHAFCLGYHVCILVCRKYVLYPDSPHPLSFLGVICLSFLLVTIS